MGNLNQIAKFPPTDTQYKVALPITQLLKELNISNTPTVATKKQQKSNKIQGHMDLDSFKEHTLKKVEIPIIKIIGVIFNLTAKQHSQ